MKKLFCSLMLVFSSSLFLICRAQYADLLDFNNVSYPEGAAPKASLIWSGHKLYGMTPSGGLYGYGVIFSVDTDGTGYRDLYDFDTLSGQNPAGGLTLVGGRLYGMTELGGTVSNGTVFSIDSDGSGFEVLLNFGGPNGFEPRGSLIPSPSGTALYGMTYSGGTSGAGVIFSIDTNYVLDTAHAGYKRIFSFDGTHGGYPFGSLLISGHKFYGMTMNGGLHSNGNIFSIDTNGTDYNDMYDFPVLGTTGALPNGSLIISGGKLFGMANNGGATGDGTVFSIDTNGTGLVNFLSFGVPDGSFPFGDLTLYGNTLFGLTEAGGLNNLGNIISLDTGFSSINDLYDFNSPGYYPYGSLTLVGNTFFGMASSGGTHNEGVIFRYRDTMFAVLIAATPYYCPAAQGTAIAKVEDGKKPYTYLWLPGGQTTDTISNLTAGTYSVSVSDNSGRTVTSSCVINNIPFTLNVRSSPDTIVVGDTAYLDAYCHTPANYIWSTGATTSSIKVIPLTTTTYFVKVITLCGTDSAVVTLVVVPCANTFNEPICIATVDTATNKAEVLWGRTNSPPQGGYGNYNIYRDSVSGYTLTHTQPLNVLSEYIDPNSNPSAGPVSYRISTTDSCTRSAMSPVHTTIFLTTTSGFNVYILNWTGYVGYTPTLYRIYRGQSMSSLVQIDSVGNWVLSYHDTLPPPGSFYAIEAVSPSGICVPTLEPKSHRISLTSLSGSFSNGFNTGILTGIGSVYSISNLSVYPNPSNGKVILTYFLNNGGNVLISVFNEFGEINYKKTEYKSAGKITESLNITNLSSGIYSLKIQTDKGILVKKLVVMN